MRIRNIKIAKPTLIQNKIFASLCMVCALLLVLVITVVPDGVVVVISGVAKLNI